MMVQHNKRPITSSFESGNKQQGAVLAVALIFLLVLTLLGVSSMKSTLLEEKMAGNMRDQSLAFQAAEAALRDGEAFIEALASTGGFKCEEFTTPPTTAPYNFPNCTNDGQFVSGTNLHEILEQDPWNSSNGYRTVSSSSTINGVSVQPRYFIIHNADLTDEAKTSLNLGPGYGGIGAGKDITAFAVVARGVGGTDKAPVILTSYYGKRF